MEVEVHSRKVTSSFVQADLKVEIETFWKSEVATVYAWMMTELHCPWKTVVRSVFAWNKSIKRDGDHYSLDIPFRQFPPKLQNNLPMARQRLEGLHEEETEQR